MVARLSGLIVLILGLLFWTGQYLQFVQLHMGFGVVLVLALWTLAFLAFRAGVDRSIVAIAVAWGLAVPILGGVQLNLPPGGGYGIVRVIHLLLGLGAIGLAERLAARIKRKQTTAPRS
jgi:hypothetical protein